MRLEIRAHLRRGLLDVAGNTLDGLVDICRRDLDFLRTSPLGSGASRRSGCVALAHATPGSDRPGSCRRWQWPAAPGAGSISVWVITEPLTIAVARISVGKVVPKSSGLDGRCNPAVLLISVRACSLSRLIALRLGHRGTRQAGRGGRHQTDHLRCSNHSFILLTQCRIGGPCRFPAEPSLSGRDS